MSDPLDNTDLNAHLNKMLDWGVAPAAPEAAHEPAASVGNAETGGNNDLLSDLFAPDVPVSHAPVGDADAGIVVSPAEVVFTMPSYLTPHDQTLEQIRVAHEAEMGEQAAAAEERRWDLIDFIRDTAIKTDLAKEAQAFELTRDIPTNKKQYVKFRGYVNVALEDYSTAQFGEEELEAVILDAYYEMVGIGVLGPVWFDTDVTEISVNRWDKVFVERFGHYESTTIKFRSNDHALWHARHLAARLSGREVSRSNPIVSAELPDARVQIFHEPVVDGGVAISIRLMRPLLGLTQLLERHAMSAEMAQFLGACVRSKAGILVSGSTGSGKTTIVNALSEFIPRQERVLTIEDAFELKIAVENWVRLRTKERASADDQTRVTQADLMIGALRARPDRIIVGEIREPAGAAVMLDAAGTGHDGTMTTIHADNAAGAVNDRLAEFVSIHTGANAHLAQSKVARSLEVVVQVTRERGMRYVSEISLIDQSCVTERGIVPELIFVGRYPVGADHAIFQRVGDVRADTVLARRMINADEQQFLSATPTSE